MESKAVGFDPLLKAYGFGLRIPELFTGGFDLHNQANKHKSPIYQVVDGAF